MIVSSEIMANDRFEDLIIWKKAVELAEDIFNSFKNCKQFSLKNQVERAVISVSTNIAEGFEQGTNKQFIRYLYIAKGSCGEVRSLVKLADRLDLVDKEQAQIMAEKSSRLSVSIHKFISSRSQLKA